jgi:hypothetical protein
MTFGVFFCHFAIITTFFAIMHFWLSKDCINCVSVLQTLCIVLVDPF